MARTTTQRKFFPHRFDKVGSMSKAEHKKHLESKGYTNIAYQGHTRNERNPERGFYATKTAEVN